MKYYRKKYVYYITFDLDSEPLIESRTFDTEDEARQWALRSLDYVGKVDMNLMRCELDENGFVINTQFMDTIFSKPTLHKNNVVCPLCGANMAYQHANETHFWSCEACPSVLFEYYNSDNIKDLQEKLQ